MLAFVLLADRSRSNNELNISIDVKSMCDSCHCAPGYEGIRCESNVNDCDNNKCQNNATCMDLVQAYRCDCSPGYMGEYCEAKIPFCTKGHDPCENGGRCVDHRTHYSCECPVGFAGLNCSTNLDDCTNHLCQVRIVICYFIELKYSDQFSEIHRFYKKFRILKMFKTRNLIFKKLRYILHWIFFQKYWIIFEKWCNCVSFPLIENKKEGLCEIRNLGEGGGQHLEPPNVEQWIFWNL